MSRENVERFRAATELFNAFGAAPTSNVSDFLEFIDPEIHFEPQQSALQGSYAGLDGVREWLADLAEHYGAGRIHFDDVRDLGDQVLALGTGRVTGMGSGIDIDVPMAVIATFRDGRMTSLKDYGDRDKALAAAGLPE
jgi:ketosteroid isomerase-like protein